MSAAPTAAGPGSAGYTQPWVVQPGGTVALHASLADTTLVDIVRIHCANAELPGHGPKERLAVVEQAQATQHPAGLQPLVPGAQVAVHTPCLPDWPQASLVLAVQRQARGQGGQVLSLTNPAGQGLRISLRTPVGQPAALLISATPGEPALELALPGNDWLLLTLDMQPNAGPGGPAQLRVRAATCRATVPDGVGATWREHFLPLAALPAGAPSHVHLGTHAGQQASADVRLDLVSVLPRRHVEALSPAQLLGCDSAASGSAWEQAALQQPVQACLLRARLGKGASTEDLARLASISEAQRPYSGVRGVRWDGRAQGPTAAPAHYTALHCNADTLLDAHWQPTRTWQVPTDLASGAYAFRLRAAERPDEAPVYASFFVTAAQRPRHAVAVLLPTYTYLAYSNATEDMRGPVITAAPHAAEERLNAVHPAHGRSIYERHTDGQSVLWASSRRPLWSVAPGNRPWGLVADSWLLDWLDRQGVDHDIITDHDLHRLGDAALKPYQVVLTGHHPEYTSTAMWDGLWRYLHAGGRLLYLGGNGFYWRTACDEAAEIIEVRRAEDGTRPSIAPPGEYHCAFSGEYGGLWRRLGRPPQQLVGVGMAAQGFDRATHYRKLDAAHAPETAFVFEGVDASSFGHSGWWGGGASGWEIDRSDADLGTPAGTWWLARSEGHAPSMLRTKEELLSYIEPFNDAKARSDLALVPMGRGDVFAVGSMTWTGALHGDGNSPTDVAQITANVLRRFLDPAPLPRRAG